MYGGGFGLPWIGADVEGPVAEASSIQAMLADPDVDEARRVSAVHRLLRASWRDVDDALPLLVAALNEPLLWLPSEVVALLGALPSTFAAERWIAVGPAGIRLWRGTPVVSRESLFVDDGIDAVFALGDVTHAGLPFQALFPWLCVDAPTWLLTTMRHGRAPRRQVLALDVSSVAHPIDDGVVLHLAPAWQHGEVRHTRACVVDGAMLPGTATERVVPGSVVQTSRTAVCLDAHLQPSARVLQVVWSDGYRDVTTSMRIGERQALQRGHLVALGADRVGVVDSVAGHATQLRPGERVVVGLESVVWREDGVQVLRAAAQDPFTSHCHRARVQRGA